MEKKKGKQRSLVHHIVANTMILMVPIVLLIVLFLRIYATEKEKQYIDSEYAYLQQYEKNIDDVFERFALTANQIAGDSVVSPYNWTLGNYNTRVAIRQMNLYWVGNNDLNWISMCVDGTSRVYGMTGILNVDVFLNQYFVLTGREDVEPIEELMFGKRRFGFLGYNQLPQKMNNQFILITYPIGGV